MKKEELLLLLKDFITHCEKHIKRSDLKDKLVLVGGSAISFKDNNRQTEDIDIYLADKRLKKYIDAFLPDFVKEKQKQYGQSFHIDITCEKNIWSDVFFPYLDKSGKREYLTLDNQTEIGLVDTESLLIAKAASGREKDRLDISVLLKHADIEKTFLLFSILNKTNESYVLENVVENIISTCIEDKKVISQKIVNVLPKELKEFVKYNYQQVLCSEQKRLNTSILR
jgi:hypothetical protein